ncbi:hypothetical protein ACGFJ7_12720 [Actinoplanes sp. NPDC048988]|uniref:hypothetical protein n=1 Tax=Actinoplanes sp. NPDC048988 TaxID=3363901 RepID=UPI00370FA90E
MVRLLAAVWQFGLPVVLVLFGAGALVAAVTDRERPRLRQRIGWFGLVVWLKFAGEAAFGDGRPRLEREWKGLVAVLLGLAALVWLVKWLRWRRRDAARRDAARRDADRREAAQREAGRREAGRRDAGRRDAGPA